MPKIFIARYCNYEGGILKENGSPLVKLMIKGQVEKKSGMRVAEDLELEIPIIMIEKIYEKIKLMKD